MLALAEKTNYIIPEHPGFKARHVEVLYHLNNGTPLNEILSSMGIRKNSLMVYLSEMRAIGCPVPTVNDLKIKDPKSWDKNWFLGPLCKREHRWNGAEKSLRDKRGDGGNSVCLECRRTVYYPRVKVKRLNRER